MKSYSDNNECNSNNGGCSGTCHNTAGGYYCTCSTGYSLNNDQHGCTGKILYYYITKNNCILVAILLLIQTLYM